MLSLRGLRANTPSHMSYTEEEIIAMVRKGKKRGHIPGVSSVLTEKRKTAIFINEPRGTYIDAEIDEIKEEAKRTRRELHLLRRVVSSDDHMSQMLTQLESHHEIGGGSESGSGGVGIMSRSGMRMSAGMRTLTGMRRFNTFYIWDHKISQVYDNATDADII
ncbi:hypothetical protein Tco_1456297 [Tanacetum coccineum]